MKHILNDKVLTAKDVRKIEKKLNSETESWLNILKVAENVNQFERTKRNLKSTENPIPTLRGTSKDHKVPDNPIIGPDLRPIMGAKVEPNTSLAQIGCKILIAIADSEHSKAEVKSTEEVLRHFEDYNKIENRQINKPKALFSMDIKSFVPLH